MGRRVLIPLIGLLAFVFSGCLSMSYKTITGTVIPGTTVSKLEEMAIHVEGTNQTAKTDVQGKFSLSGNQLSFKNKIITAVSSSDGVTLQTLGGYPTDDTAVITPATTIAVEVVNSISPFDRNIFPFGQIVDVISADANLMDDTVTKIQEGTNHLFDVNNVLNKLVNIYAPYEVAGNLSYVFRVWDGNEIDFNSAPELTVEKTGESFTYNGINAYQVYQTFDDKENPSIVIEQHYGITEGRLVKYYEDPNATGTTLPYVVLALRYYDPHRRGALSGDVVSVPAGVFDALKVTQDYGDTKVVTWYVPFVGVAKQDVYSADGQLKSRMELLSYQ